MCHVLAAYHYGMRTWNQHYGLRYTRPVDKDNDILLACYQVMVLNSVFVDCADRVISWSVHEDSPLVSSLELLPTAPAPSLPAPGCQRSLMAPVEGSIDSLLCTNDLQSLFELAEVLYRVNIPMSSLEPTSRASQVVSIVCD